jgi:hypothetical protein
MIELSTHEIRALLRKRHEAEYMRDWEKLNQIEIEIATNIIARNWPKIPAFKTVQLKVLDKATGTFVEYSDTTATMFQA